MTEYGYGFKFLTPYGSTIYKGEDFYYNLPNIHQKWSDYTTHPKPLDSFCSPFNTKNPI